MAYAPNTYTTNGTDRDYNITFPFLRESDIRVTVFDASGNLLTDSADYDFSIQKPDATFQVRVVQNGTINNNDGGTALASGSTVTISRVTDISTLVTVFQDGASLRASDINALISQINYALEEFGDNTTSALGKNITQTAWDATSLRITNLAQPTADNDAVRKVDVDSGIGPDITTVAGIASDVTNVANDATDIGVLAADISGTNTIGTVSTNIANVNTVATDIANVNTVAADTADIGTVAADIQVGGPDNIGTVANAIGDVGIVAGINGQVQTVAGAIANVNTVAADTADIGTVATNIANVNTVAGISSDVTSLAPQASNIGTLTQTANLTALQNAQANATAAQSALNQLNNKYHGSHTNVAGNDAEVLADIANDANLTLEAGDLYFDSTNSKLRYYDGSNWYNAAAAQVINTTSLQNVGDVNAYSGLTTDDFLKYDGTGWQNVTPTAVKSALSIAAGDVSGLGTAAVENVGAFATAAQGTTADAAVQPNTSPELTGLTIDNGSGGANVKVGYTRNADGNAFIDLVSVGSSTTDGQQNYGARFIRAPGADSNTTFTHRGTGELQFKTEAASNLRFQTNNSNAMLFKGADQQVQLSTYGSGTHTGTAAKSLAVDTSGNVIEEQDVSSSATPEFAGLGIGTAPTNALLELDAGGNADYLIVGGDNVNNGRGLVFSSASVGSLVGAHHDIKALSSVGKLTFSLNASAAGLSNPLPVLEVTTNGTNDPTVESYNAGNMVSVRKADRRATVGTHTLVGGASLYYGYSNATYDISDLTPGDIVTIYCESGPTITVGQGSGSVVLFKDGDATGVASNQTVTIGQNTIATITCVSATKAIISGSDLT